MKRKPKAIDFQAAGVAQRDALSILGEAVEDATANAQAHARCTTMLADRLEEIETAINALWSLNETGELNAQDWWMVTEFFDRIAAVAPKLHIKPPLLKVSG